MPGVDGPRFRARLEVTAKSQAPRIVSSPREIRRRGGRGSDVGEVRRCLGAGGPLSLVEDGDMLPERLGGRREPPRSAAVPVSYAWADCGLPGRTTGTGYLGQGNADALL